MKCLTEYTNTSDFWIIGNGGQKLMGSTVTIKCDIYDCIKRKEE